MMKTEVAVAMAIVVMMGAAWAFELGDGKRAAAVRGSQANCYMSGETCGLLHTCCEGLICTGPFDGRCKRDCYMPGESCGLLHSCCEGLRCTGPFDGKCEIQQSCFAKGDPCTVKGRTPCCYPFICVSSSSGATGICINSNQLPTFSSASLIAHVL